LGIPAIEAVGIVVAKNERQKVYANIAYTWFFRARKQLSSLQLCVGSEGFTDVLLVVVSKVAEVVVDKGGADRLLDVLVPVDILELEMAVE
jgi:hypothetical protein